MTKQDDKFTLEAKVTQALPNAMFKVELPNEQKTEILAYVSGKMRRHYIRILPGDTVTVEMSPYDLTKGRITFRHLGYASPVQSSSMTASRPSREVFH